jgi:DNA ligase-1
MNFSTFATYLKELEKTSSRLTITHILAQIFQKTTAQEIDKVCYLALGRLAPKYAGIELMLAEKMMIRALAVAFKKPEEVIKKSYKKLGDLGEVAIKFKTTTKSSGLSISEVYDKLLEIAQESGEGSQERKINRMVQLINQIDSLGAKYLVRMSLEKLRLGFSDMTVLDALSWSKTGDKSLRKPLEDAFNVLADIGKIAQIFKKNGIAGIKKIKSEVGVPILPAKAERLKTPKEILEKMGGECAIEPKYDGLRVQIHFDKSKKVTFKNELKLFEDQKHFVQIFSRNLENMTHMFPDIVQAAQKLQAKSIILDGEAIAYNPSSGKFLPFQETIQRKRKHGIKEKALQMPLKVFCFDILNLDNKSLLELPFVKRRKLLEEVLAKSKGEEKGIILTQQRMVKKEKDFEDFFKEVVNEGLEGLMAKKLDAVYQAGARNFNWVKYKAGMQSELADTIDCMVMGYYRGRGKRSKFGIGAFLVGIPNKDKFLTVSKIGTGLTDEQWREMYKRCEKLKAGQKPNEYQVDKNLNPDIWCRPQLIVEIEADTITKSPIHTAGLALRFPRLKRFRDDKDPEQATSLSELEKIVRVKQGNG